MTIEKLETNEKLSREDRTFIVSNVAVWAPSVHNADYDGPHKWTISLRGSEDDIQRVIFILPISYRPNVIEVTQPPFEITKRSWGHFPVRCQIFFKYHRNRPLEIIHTIEIDTCYGGYQVQSKETKVELGIYVGKIEQIKNIVPQSNDMKRLRTLAQEQEELFKLMNSIDFTKSIFKSVNKIQIKNPEYRDELNRVQLFSEYCPALLDHTYARWTTKSSVTN